MPRRHDPLKRRVFKEGEAFGYSHDADALKRLFPDSKGSDLIHLGFDCNKCGNNRTVMMMISTGKCGDYQTNTRPDQGAPILGYTVICLSDLTKSDVTNGVALAHQKSFHPKEPFEPIVINAVGYVKAKDLKLN